MSGCGLQSRRKFDSSGLYVAVLSLAGGLPRIPPQPQMNLAPLGESSLAVFPSEITRRDQPSQARRRGIALQVNY